MHGDDVLVIDPQVRAERAALRLREAAAIVVAVILVVFRPALQRTDTMLLPPLHRAARAGAFVVVARPLVVAPRHVVEHPGAHLPAAGGDAGAGGGRGGSWEGEREAA